MRISATIVVVLFGASASMGQTTGSLRGSVIDAGSGTPLHGAAVSVITTDTTIATATDSTGHFRFSGLPTGIHRVRASHLGYASAELPEMWVRAGKEEVLELALHPAPTALAEAEVSALAPHRMHTIGAYPLTVEQSLRFPATFFDPARVANTLPGVAQTNDQANHFSVRGNGPASNAWLLEGAEIVTPNHLTNAGTASDLPVLSGGGVTILSAQMLGSSRLLVGSQDAAYGNALGGIMDLRLRRGANERQAYTAQAGLLGIDLSTEGPIKKGGASYLVNYRYSTVGLLSAMGVDLGDEVIAFQDLSFHVSVPVKRASISLFGFGGMSSNRFKAKEDSTEWEFDKDSQDIDYNARMGAAGGTLRLPLGAKAVWTTTAVFSRQEQNREETGFFFRRQETPSTYLHRLDEGKASMVSHVRGVLGKRLAYQVGGSTMERAVFTSYGTPERSVAWLIRPYAQGGIGIGNSARIDIGFAWSFFTTNSTSVPEPRLAYHQRIGNKSSLMLAAGQRGQVPAVQNFRMTAGTLIDNTRIGMVRSQDAALALEHSFAPHVVLRGEVFHQRLLDVPVIDTSGLVLDAQYFSMVNTWDNYAYTALDAVGTAVNTGVELSLRHDFHRGLYFLVNATLFDARYTDAFGKDHHSRWNTGFIGNAMIGREFAKQKERLKRTWGVNLRATANGGQRYTPIMEAGSEPWGSQYPTYHRIDLRVYLKREREGRTSLWALDLQNALNTRNEAYRYFDQRKNEVVTKHQLGLIPNLSYRIEF